MSDSNSSLDETIKMRSPSPSQDDAQATQRIPGRAGPEPAGASSEETVKLQKPPVESDLQPTQQVANPIGAPDSENQPTVQVQVGPLSETQPTLPRSASTADQPTVVSRSSRLVAPVSSVGEPKPFIRRGGGFSFSTISPWILVAAAAIGLLLILFGIGLALSARGGAFWARPTPTATLAPTATATLTPPPTAVPPTQTSVPATPTSAVPTATPRPDPTALEVGVLAKVTPPTGLKLKVRGTAGVAGELLGELEADSQVKILEGPVDANNLKWWKIDNGQGLVGWSAEGSGGETYLVPVGWAQ